MVDLLFSSVEDVILFHGVNVIIFHGVPYMVLSFILCYYFMLSFLTVCKCYHFCVIIFPCKGWVLSFMLSFNVIIFCYHFPTFFFFLKTWHTRGCGASANKYSSAHIDQIHFGDLIPHLTYGGRSTNTRFGSSLETFYSKRDPRSPPLRPFDFERNINVPNAC